MLLALAGVSSVAMAQQKTEVVEEFGVIQVQDKYQVITNPFWSNWFFSIGGGAEATFGDNDKAGSFGKRISPTLNFAIGKWFTPGLGVRLQYSGLQARGYTYDAGADYVKGTQMDDGYYKQRFDYMNLHGDVMFNLNALFGGYNQHRVYEIIPYVGAGFVHTGKGPGYDELGINAGLINRFRLSSALDLNVELRGLLMKGSFGNSGPEGLAGLTVGVTYKFKKRGWDAVPTVPMVPESQLNDMRDRVNALKGENESLKRDLVEARNKKPEVIVKKEGGFVPRLVVVFNIGKSNISKREYMNIEAMAKGIKANPEKTFTVTGYADKGTGSAEYNMKLSKKRAEAVRDLMVNEFGVPASQLKVDYKGGVGNMFYDDAKLSRVAIVEE